YVSIPPSPSRSPLFPYTTLFRSIVKGYPAEFLHHPPTPQHPRDLGLLASGAHLKIIDYAPTVEAKLNPKRLNDGGAPALHFAIADRKSTRLNSSHEWISYAVFCL